MDYRDIRTLLEKYWQGESSLEEEKQIKLFFSRHPDKLPDDLEEIRDLFGFYEDELHMNAPEFPPLFIQDIKKKNDSPGRIFILLKSYWKYAAILLLLLGSMVLYQSVHHEKSLTTAEDTYQEPQKAFETTRKALELIAANLNKGKNGMEKLSLLNEAEQTVKGGDKK